MNLLLQTTMPAMSGTDYTFAIVILLCILFAIIVIASIFVMSMKVSFANTRIDQDNILHDRRNDNLWNAIRELQAKVNQINVKPEAHQREYVIVERDPSTGELILPPSVAANLRYDVTSDPDDIVVREVNGQFRVTLKKDEQ